VKNKFDFQKSLGRYDPNEFSSMIVLACSENSPPSAGAATLSGQTCKAHDVGLEAECVGQFFAWHVAVFRSSRSPMF